MPILTLIEVETAVRASWSVETAYCSADYRERRPSPARGQCGTTALVVQDLLGGDLIVADLLFAGRTEGVHYWNRLPDGREVDLTRDQFAESEVLVNPRVATSHRRATGPAEEAYRLLQARVMRALTQPAPDFSPDPDCTRQLS
jgi:hypothetical protein